MSAFRIVAILVLIALFIAFVIWHPDHAPAQRSYLP